MKKMMAALLSIVILLCLAGCRTQDPSASRQDNTAWVAYEEVSASVKSEQNKDIFVYSYQQPVLSHHSDGAKVINNKLDNATTAFLYGSGGVQELTELAKMDCNESWFSCYALERTVSAARIDDTVASFRYTDYAFTGGAHGYTAEYGVTYHMSTGEQLSLASITHDEWALKETCRQYIMDLTRTEEYDYGKALFEGYESMLDSVLNNWIFVEDGLQFIAQPYVIAPYALGTLRFTVPYEKLERVLDETWMPGSRSVGSGSLTMVQGATEVSNMFVIADGTQPLTFKANGSLYSFSVEEVRSYRNDDGDVFYIVAQHLYSPKLDGGTIFTLQVPDVETLPNTMLRYETADGTEHQFYITYNGKTGNTELTEANPLLARDD